MGRLFCFSKTMDRYDIVAACFSPENKFHRCQLVVQKINLLWHFFSYFDPLTRYVKVKTTGKNVTKAPKNQPQPHLPSCQTRQKTLSILSTLSMICGQSRRRWKTDPYFLLISFISWLCLRDSFLFQIEASSFWTGRRRAGTPYSARRPSCPCLVIPRQRCSTRTGPATSPSCK